MLIVGFGNKARQGKDTAANAIKNYYRFDTPTVGIFKFATALYQEVNDWLRQTHLFQEGYDPSGCYIVPADETNNGYNIEIPKWVQPEPNAEISELAPYGKHPKLLQWWGTDYRRAQDQDYWTKKLFASIPSNTDIALVTDVRFPNEADGIKQRGGYNVNLQRLYLNGEPYVAPDRPADHISEIALDKYAWDFYIKASNPKHTGMHAVSIVEYLRNNETY